MERRKSVLIENEERFPAWFRDKIGDLASTSTWLRRERELSLYGDEETGLPPQRLYTKVYAKRALDEAEVVVENCSRLIGGI